MNIQKLIVAAVATRGVFRRFAELSEDEKKEVVEKVKTKMQENKGEDDETTTEETKPSEGESPEKDTETAPEEERPDADEDADSGADEEDIFGDEDDDSDTDDEDDETEDEGDSDDEEGDDDTEEVEEIEPESKEPAESETEEPVSEPEDESEKPVEVDEDKKDEIESIVNDLVDEVKTIKQDGQVAPKDVMGLIQNMMEMVNLLVQAKPPVSRRRRRGATREFEIAMKVAGRSYAIEGFNIEVEGWQPVNVDVMREIQRNIWFDFRDDLGDLYEDGQFQIVNVKRLDKHLTWQEEERMKQRKEAPVTQIFGRIPKGSASTALKALQQQLGRKFDLDVRELR
jgi:hypothetical protein